MTDLAADAGAHHGIPLLTTGDMMLLGAMRLWIETVRKIDRYGIEWLPSDVDMLKSRLFWRIRSGKQPLPEPPPTAYSCPWYELIEDDRPHWAYDMWVNPHGDTCAISQCGYAVEVFGENRYPEVVRFGSYRFKTWMGDSPYGPGLGKVTPRGWWIQRIVAKSETPTPE